MRTKLIVAGVCSILAAAVISACDKKVGKIPDSEPAEKINCDTITYTKHIKTIMDESCALSGCHDGTNPYPLLSTYEQVKDRADAGRLKIRVLDEQPSRMPPAPYPALTAAQKEVLACWLNNGKKQ